MDIFVLNVVFCFHKGFGNSQGYVDLIKIIKFYGK